MILTVIGCTGSFAGPDSPASCYLLTGTDHEGRTWRVLMDLGNGSLGALQRHIELSEIDAVLISHLHPDHCVDLAGLHVAVKWDPRGWEAGPVPVWGPDGMMDYMEAAHVLASAETIENEFTIGQWEDGRAVEIGPSDLCQSDIDRYISMDVPAVTAAALVARPGSPALHEDLVFLPVASPEEAEPVAEPAADDEVGEPGPAPATSAAAPAEDDAALDWAALVAAAPEPGPAPDGPVRSLAEIEALSPEQRLALFA